MHTPRRCPSSFPITRLRLLGLFVAGLLGLSLARPAQAQVICSGDFFPTTQAQVDAFAVANCTIMRDIAIGPSSDITNLDGLSGLTSVLRDLNIFGNDAMSTLDGLSGLTSVGRTLTIFDNGNLAMCSCGLQPLFSSDGIGHSINMSSNAPGGDCNNDGADISAEQCFGDSSSSLEADIEDLVTAGDLMPGHGQSLINKLDATQKQVEKGNIQDALNKLETFIAQVENLLADGEIGGVDPEATAAALIAQAEALIAVLESLNG